MPGGVQRQDFTITKTLGARRRKAAPPSNTFKLPVAVVSPQLPEPGDDEPDENLITTTTDAAPAAATTSEQTWAPLVLWQPAEGDVGKTAVNVDGVVCKFLRDHQREGVQFMVRSLSEMRSVLGVSGKCDNETRRVLMARNYCLSHQFTTSVIPTTPSVRLC